jgi:hypothetical protein
MREKKAQELYRGGERSHSETAFAYKGPESCLSGEQGLQPTVFYPFWQQEFFERGAAAFHSKNRPDSLSPLRATKYSFFSCGNVSLRPQYAAARSNRAVRTLCFGGRACVKDLVGA